MPKKFSYQGKEYDFFYTADNESVVERYDNAEKEKNKQLGIIKDEGLPKVEENRKICISLCGYIDGVLGEGTCNNVLGEKTTPTEILKLANTLLMYVAGRMNEESTATE